MDRRIFLTGIIAAPAVVAASSLMPIKALAPKFFVDVYAEPIEIYCPYDLTLIKMVRKKTVESIVADVLGIHPSLVAERISESQNLVNRLRNG